MLQFYDINVPVSGADFPVASPGRFLYFLAGSAGGADTTIKVRAGNTGSSFLLKPGQSIRLADADKSVDTWYISNYAKGAPILGQILVGDGEFNDNRISGSVEVIDGGKARSLANQSYMMVGFCAAVAAQYSFFQYWNPANSGKRMVVEQILTQTAVANNNIGFGLTATQLTGPTGFNPRTKKSDGTQASSMAGYIQTDATSLMLSTSGLLGSIPDKAILPLKEPIIIAPGYGLTFRGNTVNQDISTMIEFFEEAVA